jgi:putative ABC transport system permease protein
MEATTRPAFRSLPVKRGSSRLRASRALLSLRIMVRALANARLRSSASIGVMGLGIAAMTVMMALSSGADAELRAIADQNGRNLFMIKAGEVLSQPGRGTGWYVSTRLDMADVRDLQDKIVGVEAVVPILERSLPVKFEGQDMVTSVRGVSPNYLRVRNFQVKEGRALDSIDEEKESRVALVGSFVAEKLAPDGTLVGGTLLVGGIPFEVAGQLAPKGVSSDGTNEDDQILVPAGTAARRVFNVDYLSRIVIQVDTLERMDDAKARARELLRENHRLQPSVADDFEILDSISSSRISQISSGFITGMARIFALTTLSIACVGVFAVTYLNVKDRTGEIGLRKALGATRGDIALLFIAEACLLSVLGGMAGLAVGGGGSALLAATTGWNTAFDRSVVLFPFALSIVIGFAFSLVPALRAASMTPVEALKFT